MRGVAIDTLLINPARRAVLYGDRLSAALITGYDKIKSGYGNGDCLLLDFRNGVFAVSDSSERFPQGSRGLLSRLSALLDSEGLPGDTGGWDVIMRKVYDGQKYQFKATLSCAAVKEDESGVSVMVVHGGDSTVMVIDTADGSIRHLTMPDMNFAGRSRKLSILGEWRVQKRSERIVLCSDGVWDLLRDGNADPRESLALELASTPVAGVPSMIEKKVRRRCSLPGHVNFDDAAIMVLDPFSHPGSCDARIVMGGTTPVEEGRFHREKESTPGQDRWMDRNDYRLLVKEKSAWGIQEQ